MTMDKRQLINQMRIDIAEWLVQIEDVIKGYGLPMTGITLVARDPTNDKMILVLSSESDTDMRDALRLAAADGKRKMDGHGHWVEKQEEPTP